VQLQKGATAKALAKSFMEYKKRYYYTTQEELLKLTLSHRMNSYDTLGITPLDEFEQEALIKETKNSLKNLILLIIHIENPYAEDAMINNPKLYENMLEVIDNVVNKYASGE